jgi:4-hydroxy-2-oxoheptanedioate aldolase
MRYNTAKQKMYDGQPAIGGAACMGSPLAAEILAKAGVDYVLVDDQHSCWQPDSMLAAFRSIVVAGSVPMARVGKNDFYHIGAMLDRGALGIVVPMVHTADDAAAAAYAMRYQPSGSRSIGAYGSVMYGEEYMNCANEEMFLAVQIESKQGFDNVEQIMAVEGVDGCWIGPADLAASMKLDLRNPADQKIHEQAIVHIMRACIDAHKIPGIACLGLGELRIRQGFLFVTPLSDWPHVGPSLAELRNVPVPKRLVHP